MTLKKELNDEELDQVTGGMMAKPSSLNNNKGLPDLSNLGGNASRTTSTNSCSSFSRNPDKDTKMICENCIYFQKQGTSGVCKNKAKGIQTVNV